MRFELSGASASKPTVGKAMVENAAELRQYTLKQRTEVSMNGEVRSVRLDQVRFDLDGNMERIPLTSVAAEAPKVRGLPGKVVANKREETANYHGSGAAGYAGQCQEHGLQGYRNVFHSSETSV